MVNSRSITDPKRRARICACYVATESFRETGKQMGISDETVRNIVNADRPDLMPAVRGKLPKRKSSA